MTRWKLWLAGGLAVALAGALWAWRDEIETRVRYAVQGEQLEQALREAEQDARAQRKLRNRAEDIAEVRRARVEQLQRRERDLSDSLQELEKQNDAVREWANTDMPDAIIDRLRQPRADREDDNGNRDTAD